MEKADLTWAAGTYLVHSGHSHGLQGKFYSSTSSDSSPYFSFDLVHRVVSHIFFLTPACSLAFIYFFILPFWSTFSQRYHQLGCRAQPCPVLELAVFGTGQMQPFLTKEPCSPPLPTPRHLHTIQVYFSFKQSDLNF